MVGFTYCRIDTIQGGRTGRPFFVIDGKSLYNDLVT